MSIVAQTKIKCKHTSDDVLIVSYAPIANCWGCEDGHTDVICPHNYARSWKCRSPERKTRNKECGYHRR